MHVQASNYERVPYYNRSHMLPRTLSLITFTINDTSNFSKWFNKYDGDYNITESVFGGAAIFKIKIFYLHALAAALASYIFSVVD